MTQKENYAVFVEHLPELLKSCPGRFALVGDGKVLDTYANVSDALCAGGPSISEDGGYIVQEIAEAAPALLLHFDLLTADAA